MTTSLSPNLLDPDIDLTSEQSQWRDVELWYQQVCYDEFQFTDRVRFFAIRWLLEQRKWPFYMAYSMTWDWFDEDCLNIPAHARISGEDDFFNLSVLNKEELNAYGEGHETFGESVLFFCSLWPRFYVECVLPTQENEPVNAEEFWENLNLCVPGEDWRKKFCPVYFDEDYYVVQWFDVRGEVLQRMDELRDKFDRDPHYCWNWGNAVSRAVKAWRGESE